MITVTPTPTSSSLDTVEAAPAEEEDGTTPGSGPESPRIEPPIEDDPEPDDKEPTREEPNVRLFQGKRLRQFLALFPCLIILEGKTSELQKETNTRYVCKGRAPTIQSPSKLIQYVKFWASCFSNRPYNSATC
ncbi:hypothetical protein R1sor_019404 [Riccia sorocarpa]|uniref:Uncharacterized protein n=1 Tax=Riccia sorocarpa TaxID=122646 RepID=A0ABD3IGP8_9MARC